MKIGLLLRHNSESLSNKCFLGLGDLHAEIILTKQTLSEK